MCGLFGFSASPDFVRQAELYSILSYFMSFRGDHSFGVSAVFPGKRVRVFRGLGDIAHDTDIRHKIARATSLQGHTRWATVGKVTLANCHPFEAKNLLVAHNGGIWNHEDIGRADGRTYDVDSQALAWRIALGGSIKDLTGYGSVSIVDRHTGQQKVARMSGGDLVLFRLTDTERDGHAMCYVSSWKNGTYVTPSGKRLTLRETLSLYGYHVDQETEPASDAVWSMSPEGFEDTGERLTLGFGRSSYSYTANDDDLDWEVWRQQIRGTPPADIGETRYRREGYWVQRASEGWVWVEGTPEEHAAAIDDETGAITFTDDDEVYE